ncbi:MAG: type I-B CRISPR-associated endonuclease Cas1b [Candidatus Methanomethylicaceae archaeon]
MKRSVYIFSDGELKRKENTLYVETETGKKFIPVENISEILVFGEVSLNKRLLEFVTEKEVIIHFFNHYGFYVGSFYPREHFNSGYMLLKQAEHYLEQGKRIVLAKKFVHGGVENMKRVLSYYQNRGRDLTYIVQTVENLSRSIDPCHTIEQLMAIEGNIKEQYYRAFDFILESEEFRFEERSRRPPKNRLNALISFVNSLVYVTCLSEIYKTHLDPRIGFLHATNFRRFTLNLDVAEIFKPVIGDRLIFHLINKNMLKAHDFEKKLDGLVLSARGRESVVREFDERLRTTIKHRKLNRHVSYRQLIRLELFKLEKHLMGEVDYEPFVSPW